MRQWTGSWVVQISERQSTTHITLLYYYQLDPMGQHLVTFELICMYETFLSRKCSWSFLRKMSPIVSRSFMCLERFNANLTEQWPTLLTLTLIPACIINHMPSKAWDEITYPFQNFNVCNWSSMLGQYEITTVESCPEASYGLRTICKYFQMHFHSRKGLYFDSNLTEIDS